MAASVSALQMQHGQNWCKCCRREGGDRAMVAGVRPDGG